MTIRVGIIGCGKIADEHADAIARTPDAVICAVCDNEELMARQLFERCHAQAYFVSAEEMLAKAQPTVVHITTPPQSHYPLAKLCLQHGANVLIEKPFTVTVAQAEELFCLAEANTLKLTAGHNHQHSDVAVEMRRLINEGFIGGRPVHMESTFCYNLGSGQYVKAMLGDKNHWVRQLPGGLMHNVISHGVSKIAEYLRGENPRVQVLSLVSPTLQAFGETEIVDELRAIICDESGTTAYFTFSSGIKPGRHEFRIFGSANFLIADHAHQILIKGPGGSYKSYLTFFFPAFLYGRQYVANGSRNLWRFLRNRFPSDLGRRRLIAAFYRSITTGGPPAISKHEILLTARIMEAIFAKIKDAKTAT